MSMMSMVVMEIHVHSDDLRAVLRSLAETKSFQPFFSEGSPLEPVSSYGSVIQELAKAEPAFTSQNSGFGLISSGDEDSKTAVRLYGWVPLDSVSQVDTSVRGVATQPVTTHIHNLERNESGRGVRFLSNSTSNSNREMQSGSPIPVGFKKNSFLDAFRPVFTGWAVPRYGDLDPSWLVSLFCIVMFGLMFGDLGQGAVIVCLGFWIKSAKKGVLYRFRTFWPAFVSLGIGSMFMGILDGSVFANEQVLIPLERILTTMILGRSMDRFVTVLPEPGPLPTMQFFAFGEFIGLLVILSGVVLNVINLWRRAEYREALLGENGIIAGLLYVSMARTIASIVRGGGICWFDIVLVLVPLIVLIMHSPFEAFVSCTDFMVNCVTFLMIGAYALSHALLSMAFSRVAVLAGTLPAGPFCEIVAYSIGNFVIMGLEGMIVVLQCQRIVVSEFLQKFLTEPGKPFVPLAIVAE
ncbi:MAG TPA: V-type ATPase 116kDa subunit family protein [Spirochaetales bacterium]|nr:V-type ATPase 116kDa subunit family protein [Spirochaetales bacterium]